MPLSELFYNSLLVTASGVFLVNLALCYKSKCRSIKCCGCEVDRDVEAEEKFDELELQSNNNIEPRNV